MRNATSAGRPGAAHDLRIIPPDTWRWVPWRNGQGRTVELHVEGDPERPDWRLSLAVIDRDAPFSAWAGFERELVLLRGGPLELSAPDDRWMLETAGHRARFAGEAAIVAGVGARATVMNLMVRRGSSWRLGADVPIVRIAHVLRATRLHVGENPHDLASGTTLIAAGDAAISGPRSAHVMLELEAER